MLKQTKSTKQLMDEIQVLRHKVSELREVEERCQKAETALKELEERNQLLGT